ncbi:hypothetical protein D9757_012458 [Collybiopsis confluens]|uniref:PB1 domain-containing protein n=1 Tax=Collybiopsis confluens TaxID=2823264 RepID=A0A8H5D7G8_9AGAR|nr:hypothetical protein D9757_012458 [Collybiopsis confluens]
MNAGWWIWAVVLATRFHSIQPTYDWSSPGFGTAFGVYIFLTIGFQSNYLFLYFIVTDLSNTEEEVIRNAALLRGVKSAWQAVGYGLTSITIFAQVGAIYINFGLLVVAILPAWLVVSKFGADRESPLHLEGGRTSEESGLASSFGGGSVRRRVTRRNTARTAASSLIQSSYEEEEEGYASGDYEDGPFELIKIRVKDNVRGMALTPKTSFEEFMDKVTSKFSKGFGGLGLKFKDEDGGKVTLQDESDYELAIETARESSKGKAEGKLETFSPPTSMTSTDTNDFTHTLAIKLSRALNMVNPNDLLAQRVTDIAKTNAVDGFINAAKTFGKFKDPFLAKIHSDIFSHTKQLETGLMPQPVVGILVHDSEVLKPETVRQGGLVRNDLQHTLRKPDKPLEPPTPRTSVLGLDRLAKEKRAAAANGEEGSAKRTKYDDGAEPVFKVPSLPVRNNQRQRGEEIPSHTGGLTESGRKRLEEYGKHRDKQRDGTTIAQEQNGDAPKAFPTNSIFFFSFGSLTTLASLSVLGIRCQCLVDPSLHSTRLVINFSVARWFSGNS